MFSFSSDPKHILHKESAWLKEKATITSEKVMKMSTTLPTLLEFVKIKMFM